MPPWSLRRSEKGSGDGLCPRGGDGRAAGLRAGAAGSLGLPTPSHRGHSQHPGLRAGGALPPSEERGRDPALLGGSVLETGVPRAEWLLPRDMMAAGDWPAPLRWGSGPGPSHRGPWVLFEPQPGDALPLSACGQPSPPPTCWGLGKRRWEEVGAWGPHALRRGREVCGGGRDRSLGADRPQRREGSPRASEPVAADAPAWAGDGPSPGGCGLQMAEPHSHLLREVRMPPRQDSVCRAGALVAAGAPCLSFPRRAASPWRPRLPGAQLHRFDRPEFNRFPSRQMWRPDGLGKQCVWGGSEGRAASKFSRLGGTGLPPASSP